MSTTAATAAATTSAKGKGVECALVLEDPSTSSTAATTTASSSTKTPSSPDRTTKTTRTVNNLVQGELANLEATRKLSLSHRGGGGGGGGQQNSQSQSHQLSSSSTPSYHHSSSLLTTKEKFADFQITISHQWKIVKNNPFILVVSFLIFGIVSTICITLIVVLAKEKEQDEQDSALDAALETGNFFSDQLDRAILPLFSLAQFAREIDIFRDLHDRIGPGPGSNDSSSSSTSTTAPGLPFLPSSSSHRNVTGVCDDIEVLERFNDIASTVKENAKMDGILLALNMVPYQVVCLIHPLVQTIPSHRGSGSGQEEEDRGGGEEDGTGNNNDMGDDMGVIMNNTGAIGLDLIAEPTRHVYAKNVLQAEDIYIIGPVTLRECAGDDSNENKETADGDGGVAAAPSCDVSVEQAFIAALPVETSQHSKDSNGDDHGDSDSIFIDDVEYPNRWGSVEAIINWNYLVEQSGLYERFELDGRSFRLTRTDQIFNPETGEIEEEVVVLAETPNMQLGRYIKSVTIALDTTDDEWEMTVFYESTHSIWTTTAIVATVIGSLLLAGMAFTIMVQKQSIRQMRKQYLEDLAHPQKLRLRQFLEDTRRGNGPTAQEEERILKSKPIAELFPSTTVLYADIYGFSAWASEREPFQVFSLLQAMLLQFDKIARKRDVFKLEMNADVYIACCGIPDEQPDHAIRMTKFAQECITTFKELTKSLERTLGPETGDLRLRVGLSSGPCTAGVLNGESSRFQLFGDTVQVALRMMDTSLPGRVHLSKQTTTLLIEAGKKRWIQARKELTMVKGLGEMESYWLVNRRRKISEQLRGSEYITDDESDLDLSTYSGRSTTSMEIWDDDESQDLDHFQQDHSNMSKEDSLIEWQVQSISQLLKHIVAFRKYAAKASKLSSGKSFGNDSMHGGEPSVHGSVEKADIPLDEVKEVIQLPAFDPTKHKKIKNLDSIAIPDAVVSQLRNLIAKISKMYHDNPFHNFEHACHVVMSVHKLLNRIVTPEDVDYGKKASRDVASDLHDYTFGITSDPLTHFAVVFSALVHDVDHRGVSNAQLAKEKPEMAQRYKDKSIAEQNSVDLAWNLIMEPGYEDLRKCICPTMTELTRFRQLIVNTVLATDIFDPQLKALRNNRWDKAFHHDEMEINALDGSETSHSSSSETRNNSTNRKATIVIEHIIQASDVAHTMQHWNIYKKWNEKLFQEMYLGFRAGRAPKDPSSGWYKGELWFFDNYVIPLSRKLEECGVFGVASDECLFNALENRRMWALHGEQVVQDMLERVQKIPIRLDPLSEVNEENGE